MKSPDEPQLNICPNHSRPGLVTIGIGSGQHSYSVMPELAEEIAANLSAAAERARHAGGDAP